MQPKQQQQQKPKPLGLQHRVIMRRLREQIAQSKQSEENRKNNVAMFRGF